MTATYSEEFSGKTVFITGAANGIGRATALAFAREGARLALVDLDAAGNAETERLVREVGAEVVAIHADLTDEQQVQGALEETIRAFGTLDIAFNNAGQEQRDEGPTGELSAAAWDHVIATNLRSMFLSIRHEIPLLQANGGGVIVNTSSGAGVIGIKGQAAYAAAKHAVIGLTRSVALDYADAGIRVNAVAPGIIDTPMMERVFGAGEEGEQAATSQEPIGRPGHADEIAAAVLWLSHDRAAFTIGHTLVVDGGQTIQ